MDTIIKSPREIDVTAAGVVNIGYDSVSVSSEDMLSAVRAAIEKTNAATNYNGDSAARVTISLELLGDITAARKPNDHHGSQIGGQTI